MTGRSDELSAKLTESEINAIQIKLLSLLKRQTERYTMGDSSSVTVETARELLLSICRCLEISPDGPDESWARLKDCDINAAFAAGQRRLEQKLGEAKRRWYAVCSALPAVENDSMLSTLRSLGAAWKKYDLRFFADTLPCDIDYQLAVSVPEELPVIDYVNLYLERLQIENRFLRGYPAETMLPVLQQYCPDYKGLLINLFEPVFTNALGLSLLGAGGQRLLLEPEELEELYGAVENLRQRDVERALVAAARPLAVGLGDGAPEYLRLYCGALAARIAAMRDCGGLGGIFMTR